MLAATVVGVLASPFILAAAAVLDLATRSLPSADRPGDAVPAPVRDQRQHRDRPRARLLDDGRLRHRLDQPSLDRPPRTTAAVVHRRDRSGVPNACSGLRLDIDPDSIVRAHPRPGDRAVPPRQHRRRLAPDAALPAARLPHPRRDHGRTARRPRLRPHLRQDRVGVHPTRQRPGGPCHDPRARPNIDATTAVVIFPEGRLFRPDRLERAKTRLALENPERPNDWHRSVTSCRRAPAESSRSSTPSMPMSSSSPTRDSTSTHRSPNSPEPSRSATRFRSLHGECPRARSRLATASASSGSTNSGCSSTTGSPVKPGEIRSPPTRGRDR